MGRRADAAYTIPQRHGHGPPPAAGHDTAASGGRTTFRSSPQSAPGTASVRGVGHVRRAAVPAPRGHRPDDPASPLPRAWRPACRRAVSRSKAAPVFPHRPPGAAPQAALTALDERRPRSPRAGAALLF